MTNEEAIKALEQEPCENAISRQWLMECVNEGWIKFDTEKDRNIFIHLVRDIAPQPKMARWVDDKCSVCGKGIEDLIDSSDWYQLEDPKYCPFCGLKIRTESEE